MSTYVVGDIHGCYNEWLAFKNRLEQEDKDAKFILVGDIIDRGQSTVEMVQWAMKNVTEDGKYQMIMGNHEEEKIDWWNNCKVPQDNLTDDVDDLRKSNIEVDRYLYAVQFLRAEKGLLSIKNSVDWFRNLPYYKDVVINDKRFIIVHANLPFTAIESDETTLKTELDDYTKNFIVWDRGVDSFNKIPGAVLIHGHTPTIMNEAFDYTIAVKDRKYGRILNMGNRYNIDCGLAYRQYHEASNLAALRLEDLAEFYLYN